jgi:hypothetical protein
MKVRVSFDFSEHQLRTIRASYRRGGRATRQETSIFINRAIAKALDAAPEPAPLRKRPPKPPPPPPSAPPTEDEETARDRANRLQIRQMYGKPLSPPRKLW